MAAMAFDTQSLFVFLQARLQAIVSVDWPGSVAEAAAGLSCAGVALCCAQASAEKKTRKKAMTSLISHLAFSKASKAALSPDITIIGEKAHEKVHRFPLIESGIQQGDALLRSMGCIGETFFRNAARPSLSYCVVIH
ncbi:hypothetical protein [Burkholderia ubonensis]|uniref:hypothetical protein n=1 Tax=Burkholderia ubonensis TaxID=101571 RepID=UPI0018DF3E49|nr:hypothetical protein [Burkholderia ubonensis]